MAKGERKRQRRDIREGADAGPGVAHTDQSAGGAPPDSETSATQFRTKTEPDVSHAGINPAETIPAGEPLDGQPQAETGQGIPYTDGNMVESSEPSAVAATLQIENPPVESAPESAAGEYANRIAKAGDSSPVSVAAPTFAAKVIDLGVPSESERKQRGRKAGGKGKRDRRLRSPDKGADGPAQSESVAETARASEETGAPDFTAQTSGAGRPAAVAQILAAPETREPDSNGPARRAELEPEESQPPQAAEPRRESPHTRPEFVRGRSRWTQEPVLMALLLVTLIVLALDTYLTIRLTGLSDRLTAIAAKPRATAVAATAGDRPWIGVDSVKTAPFENGGHPVTTVHIVNSGHAPAYDLRSNTVGSLRSAATAAPDVPAKKGPLATTGLLMPNVGGNLTFFANTRALTAAEAAGVRSGKDVLWLAGRLDYKDAKGRTHLTTFRYRYDPPLKSFIAVPQGNTAN